MSFHNCCEVHPNAEIGNNVTIGPYAIIGDCVIGDNCIIHSHAFIGDNVRLGEHVEIHHGSVIGREPKSAGATCAPIDYDKFINIGNNTILGPHTIVYYDVKIGCNTLIGDGASIRERCEIGNRCIIGRYVTINYNVSIGNDVKIMDLSHITGNTVIEDQVFIGPIVGTANDNKIKEGYGDHILGQYISEGAIIGLGSMILPDIKIGKNTWVGAGALVTKDVKDNQLVKGMPAK